MRYLSVLEHGHEQVVPAWPRNGRDHAPPSFGVHEVGGGTIPTFTPIFDACAAAVATSTQG